jgi:hypothetical protein
MMATLQPMYIVVVAAKHLRRPRKQLKVFRA